MYLYWRIQQDLNCMGEFLQFHDPALLNAMRKWVRKNYSRMVLAESLTSLNPEPLPGPTTNGPEQKTHGGRI